MVLVVVKDLNEGVYKNVGHDRNFHFVPIEKKSRKEKGKLK